MWLLRNGKRIRVDLYIDPSWNLNDASSARNLFARFIALGHSYSDASSFAAATIWKRKWPETIYPVPIERALAFPR